MDPASHDAIVLAGGRSNRFGSDKLAVAVDGVPLLDRVLAATAGAGRRIVVGDRRRVTTPVLWTREHPTGGGPAAGVVAGLALVTAPWVLLLAGDLPYVRACTVTRLLQAGQDGDGAVLVDDSGRRQHLCCAVRAEALRASAGTQDDWHGRSVRTLLAGLELIEVAAAQGEAHDVDVPEDLPTRQEPR
jgi:molybdopterin-guanine dinucleotide biosynthesis protein A